MTAGRLFPFPGEVIVTRVRQFVEGVGDALTA
jgi:hypothetical protein